MSEESKCPHCGADFAVESWECGSVDAGDMGVIQTIACHHAASLRSSLDAARRERDEAIRGLEAVSEIADTAIDNFMYPIEPRYLAHVVDNALAASRSLQGERTGEEAR